jgi:predicted membrane-bound mannosyltransferase
VGFLLTRPRATLRATGQGHEKPVLTCAAWYLLPGPRALPWAGWTLAAAFAVGSILAWRARAARPLAWWLALHAAALASLYSLVPYKTPWLALQFLLPAALVAGLAPDAAVAALPRALRPVLATMAGFALAAALLAETRALVHRFPVDPGNPLAYSPSSPDLEALPARLAAAFVGRPAPVVHVYGDDYWPLPWYLRSYPKTGYFSAPPAPGSSPAPDAIFLTGDARSIDPAALPPPPGAGSWRADFLGLRAELPVIVLVPLSSPQKPPASPRP